MKFTIDTNHLYNTGDPDKVWVKSAMSRIEQLLTNGLVVGLLGCSFLMVSEISYMSGKLQRPLHYSYIFVPTNSDSLLKWTQYQSFSDICPDSVVKLIKSAIKENKK